MTADAPAHPLDASAGRLVAFRFVCGLLVFGLGFWAAVVGIVVWFALDGQPLAGNAVQVAGVSVLTWAGLILGGLGVPVAALVGATAERNGLARVAAEPSREPAAATDRLVDVFAARTFAEFAIAEAAGVLAALLMHVTADPVLLAPVGVLAAFLLARFPTTARARRWYDAAADRVDRSRRESAG